MHHIAIVGGIKEDFVAFMRAVSNAGRKTSNTQTHWYDVQRYVRDRCEGTCTPAEFVAAVTELHGRGALVCEIINSALYEPAIVTGVSNDDEVRVLMDAGYTLVMLGNVVDFNRDDFDFIVIDPCESSLTDLADHIVGARRMTPDKRDLMAKYRVDPKPFDPTPSHAEPGVPEFCMPSAPEPIRMFQCKRNPRYA